MKSKTIPFSQMVLSNDEFKRALPRMSAEDIMNLSPDMRAKALDIDREGVIEKFNARN